MNVRRRARRSARPATFLGAATLVAVCAALLAIPGGASASSVNCVGSLTKDPTPETGPRGVRYEAHCSENVLAYSIVTTRPIDYFTPDPVVFQRDGEPSADDHFVCEGLIPSHGFGCPGHLTRGNTVKGWFATRKDPCYRLVHADLVVTTQQLDSHDVPFITSSHPFRLAGPACPTTAAKKPVVGPASALGSLLGVDLTRAASTLGLLRTLI